MGIDWKTTGIGAAIGGGSGLALGAALGGPAGAVGGLVAGGLLGGGVGALFGKKSPNPGLPRYINGKEAPQDLYDLLEELYRDEELYQKYSQEEALLPSFLIPRHAMNYIIQRYSQGNTPSKYYARGKILSIDSISLFVTFLPDYTTKLKYLHALPLTLLAVEFYLEYAASDEEILSVIHLLQQKHGELPDLYKGEGLYRELEYYIILVIAQALKEQAGPSHEIKYETILNAILRNQHMDLASYLEKMHDEYLLDEHMMKHFQLTDQEKGELEKYKEGLKTTIHKKVIENGVEMDEEITSSPTTRSQKFTIRK